MSIEACAERVRRGDPERFRTALVAAPERRPGLMALYAFNLEIARVPWLTAEPMVAAIRLRWWLDTIDTIVSGGKVPGHEVAGPLAETIRGGALPQELFVRLVEARQRDAEAGPLPDREALSAYVADTYGTVMELAARHLGAGEEALPVVRRFARGAGVAALLRAVPALRAANRDPLPPGLDVGDLVREARADVAAARAERRTVPAEALAALLPGWQASAILAAAARDPSLSGPLAPSELRARAGLAARALSRRW